MSTKAKWLIWGGILTVLAVQVLLLLMGRQELPPLEVPSVATSPKLSTVPFARKEPRPAPAFVLPAKDAAASALAAALPDDPLSLAALQQRVQPPGALANEALLTFKTPVAYNAFLTRVVGGGLTIQDRLDDLLTARVRFDTLDQLRAEMQRQGADSAEISANFPVAIPRLPPPENRPKGGDVPFNETVFASMGITAGVDRSGWGAGVTVAVIDSGVGDHPTFRADQVIRVDLVKDGSPLDGHGTAIASLIAGSMAGAEGVAPGAQILSIRVAGGEGDSNSFILAQGITTALERGADVINVSMGSYGDAPVVQAAVQSALDKGIMIVASAGNEQSSVLAWPAAYEGVISVSGVDAKGQLAYFSNTGNPTIAAPAVGIPSGYFIENKPFLAVGNGTSQSAALVSGAVAAVISQRGNVMLTLKRNALQLQAPAQAVGAGMVRLPKW